MKWKIEHKINWNYIATLAAVLGIFLAVYYNHTQSSKEFLNEQKDFLEDQVSQLEREVDPEWHKRFNEMNAFYKGQHSYLEIQYQELQRKNDSLVAVANKKGIVHLTPDEVRGLLSILDENDMLKELNKFDSTLIEELDESISTLRLITRKQDTIIQLFEKENSHYQAKLRMSSPKTVHLLLIVIGILILFGLATIFKLIKFE